MLHNIGIPIDNRNILQKNTFAQFRWEDLIDTQQILLMKCPFEPPFEDFYCLSKTDMEALPNMKQKLIYLLHDAHKQYWMCPKEIREKNPIVSISYVLTAYYTDIIFKELITDCSTIIFHKHGDDDDDDDDKNDKILFFSISNPNRYFDRVYEMTEKTVIRNGTSFTFHVFQPALFIRTRLELK